MASCSTELGHVGIAPQSVNKALIRDRHVAPLLAMTQQKAIICVIAPYGHY